MKRIASLFLALTCAALLLCGGIQGASASQRMPSNGKPYYIMVNRAQSTVTVYGLDDDGYYTVPVKAMICSTGRKGHATPLGTYSMGGKWTWIHMLDNSYGQYCSQIKGNILFHSVCYNKKDPSTLITSEYNGLGAPASLGCVRLQTSDAKWIYDNCARGTKVTIYDDAESPGPLGKPSTLVGYISNEKANGWDPTDPREENPWHKILAASSSAPQEDLPPEEQATYAMMAQALYELSAEKSGYTHSSEMVTWAVQRRFLDGMVVSGFSPSDPISRQDMITMLYRYETDYLGRAARSSAVLTRFSDWQSVNSYAREAMRWAVGSKLIQGASASTLQPAAYASKTQLDAVLQRYGKLH